MKRKPQCWPQCYVAQPQDFHAQAYSYAQRMKTGSFQTTGTLPRIMEIDGNLGNDFFWCTKLAEFYGSSGIWLAWGESKPTNISLGGFAISAMKHSLSIWVPSGYQDFGLLDKHLLRLVLSYIYNIHLLYSVLPGMIISFDFPMRWLNHQPDDFLWRA